MHFIEDGVHVLGVRISKQAIHNDMYKLLHSRISWVAHPTQDEWYGRTSLHHIMDDFVLHHLLVVSKTKIWPTNSLLCSHLGSVFDSTPFFARLVYGRLGLLFHDDGWWTMETGGGGRGSQSTHRLWYKNRSRWRTHKFDERTAKKTRDIVAANNGTLLKNQPNRLRIIIIRYPCLLSPVAGSSSHPPERVFPTRAATRALSKFLWIMITSLSN